jgi:hypothetical protein
MFRNGTLAWIANINPECKLEAQDGLPQLPLSS